MLFSWIRQQGLTLKVAGPSNRGFKIMCNVKSNELCTNKIKLYTLYIRKTIGKEVNVQAKFVKIKNKV